MRYSAITFNVMIASPGDVALRLGMAAELGTFAGHVWVRHPDWLPGISICIGGLAQQGLSSAYEVPRCCNHRSAADKRSWFYV